MKQVFDIIPPSGSGFAIGLVVIVALLAGMAGLFGYIAWSSRRISFEISSDGLTIKSGLYGRNIPSSELIVEEARTVNLDINTGLSLSWRTNGIGMPGYSAGWFKTKNGEKVLAFVTDRRRVVYVPTRQDYSVLLSTESPDALVQALQAVTR